MKKEEIIERLKIIVEHSAKAEHYEFEIVAKNWEGYGKKRTYFSIVEKSNNLKATKHYVSKSYGYLDNITGEYVVGKKESDARENYDFMGARFEIKNVENTDKNIEKIEIKKIESNVSKSENIKNEVINTFEMMKNGFEQIDTDEGRRIQVDAKLDEMLKKELEQTNTTYWIELYTHYNNIYELKNDLNNAIIKNDSKLINKCMNNIITAIRAYRKINNIL